MVAVDYPDPPQEAQNQNQLSGVPQGAQPAGAFVEQAEVRDMSFDVDTDELDRAAYETREAINIAADNFRRFTNGINLIMAFRLLSSEKILTINWEPQEKSVLSSVGMAVFPPSARARDAKAATAECLDNPLGLCRRLGGRRA